MYSAQRQYVIQPQLFVWKLCCQCTACVCAHRHHPAPFCSTHFASCTPHWIRFPSAVSISNVFHILFSSKCICMLSNRNTYRARDRGTRCSETTALARIMHPNARSEGSRTSRDTDAAKHASNYTERKTAGPQRCAGCAIGGQVTTVVTVDTDNGNSEWCKT